MQIFVIAVCFYWLSAYVYVKEERSEMGVSGRHKFKQEQAHYFLQRNQPN